jgi:hypothetical protein
MLPLPDSESERDVESFILTSSKFSISESGVFLVDALIASLAAYRSSLGNGVFSLSRFFPVILTPATNFDLIKLSVSVGCDCQVSGSNRKTLNNNMESESVCAFTVYYSSYYDSK